MKRHLSTAIIVLLLASSLIPLTPIGNAGGMTPYTVYGYVKDYNGLWSNGINVKALWNGNAIQMKTIQGEKHSGLYQINLANGGNWNQGDNVTIYADYWQGSFHYVGFVSFIIPSVGYICMKNISTSTAIFYPEGGGGTEMLPPAPPGNRKPELSGGTVSPHDGKLTTTFHYTITYTDADNERPYSILVTIDGINHGMAYASGNYTTGAIFTYSIPLQSGDHTYWFFATDGWANSSDITASVPAPHVYYQPTLSRWAVSPMSGTPATNFTYTVTYTNQEGLEPTQMTLIIDGNNNSKPYQMTKTQGNPLIGEVFVCVVPGHLLSPTTYQITASDGNYQIQTLRNDGPLVVSSFNNDAIIPLSGDSGPWVAIFCALIVLGVIVLGLMHFRKKKQKEEEDHQRAFEAKKEAARSIVGQRNYAEVSPPQPLPEMRKSSEPPPYIVRRQRPP